MGYRLGVDLGTTWTAAGVRDGTEVSAVALGAHGPALPSVIAFDGDEVLFGEAAADHLIAEPASGAREMKRRLGDTTPFVLQGTPYTSEALIGRILGHVVGVASANNGEAPESVILTHPATWGEFKLDLLREVGRVAGLNDIELIAEPSAAAAHYARTGKVSADGLVGVYDFGGGTFDAAVLQGTDGRFELLGKAEGLDRLGGVDLDQAVIAHVDQSLDGALRELDRANPEVRQALARLREACIAAKEGLSTNSEVAIPVVAPGLSTEVRLTRAEFEAAIRPRLAESLDAFERAVGAAGVEVAALDVVLLVGGSSRIPLVAELLAARTGRPIALDTDTKAAVSLGAAGWGAGTGAGATVGGAAEAVLAVAGAAAAGAAVVGAAQASAAESERDGPKEGATRDGKAAEGGSDLERAPRTTREKAADSPKESKGRGRAAKVAAGGAAAAAAAVAVGGVAAAASGGDVAPSFTGGVDTDDRDDEPSIGGEEGDAHGGAGRGGAGRGGASGRPGQRDADPIGESESLDAFDEVAAPPRAAGRAPGPGDEAVASRVAPARAQPMPDRDPSPTGEAAPPSHDDQVDAIRDSLRARLEAWRPPPGADPEDVAALKAELQGRIDRFDPADGVAFEKAAGDLQQALTDSLEDFQQSEQIDQTRDMTGRLIDEAQSDNARDAERIDDTNDFIGYKKALSDFVDDWEPSYSDWIDANALGALKTEIQGEVISQAPFNPDGSLRDQETILEQVIRSKLDQFQRDQYVEHHKARIDDLADLRAEELAILNNPASSQQAISDAQARLESLDTQRAVVDGLFEDLKDSNSHDDAALDAALHAHLEPVELEIGDSDFAAETVSHTSLFAAAQEAAAADEASDSVDGALSTLAVGQSEVLADAFDAVAATPAATEMPTVPAQSQMTGGGEPLAPGIRTMSAEPVPDPMLDDALGVPVAAAAMAPVAPMTSADGLEPAVVGRDLGDVDEPIDEFGSVATPELPELPAFADVPDPMSDAAEELPEDDSPNPLDDLDDPLDPM